MNTKPMFSRANDNNLKKWRAGGRRQRTNILLFSLAILTIMVLLAIRIGSSAPSPQTGEHGNWRRGAGGNGPERQLAWLTEKLKLTDDQKPKIKPILEDEHKRLMALREDSSLSRQEKQAKFRDIHASTLDQIRPLLTDQQQTTLQQIEKQREQRMKARQQKGGESSAPQNE